MPVSVGPVLVFPGPSRPPLEDIPKKEKVTRSYTLRNEDVACNSPQNSSEGESSVPLGLDELETEAARTETRGPGRDPEKGSVEKMDE